jgi:HPt (histidine-containing phosphotransfer) domain-containing protein
MNDHVTKPIDPDAVFSALKRWTKQRPKPAAAATATAGAATPSPEIVLPEVAGIDTEAGLKRVAGNRRLYRSLLEQFVSKQGDAGAQITAALQKGDRELAGRIAHTVKGVAGNLGIASVQLAAEKVERAIREGTPLAAGLIEEFGSAVGSVVQDLQTGLSRTAPAPAAEKKPKPFDTEAASAALARLRALIEASDGDAADAFAAVEDALGGAVNQQQLDAVRNALGDFDFDKALSALAEIAHRCGFSSEQSEPRNG